MKRWTILALAVALTVCLSACCTQHTYSEATCTEPATCTECGKTNGEALGHDWIEADCENPKTCSVCGATEGEPLGHSWVDADCENPKTCAVCGATEGEALGHVWAGRTLEDAGSCAVCGKAGESPITVTQIDFLLIDGAELKRLGVAPDGSVNCLAVIRGEEENQVLLCDEKKNIIRKDVVRTGGLSWRDTVYFIYSDYNKGGYCKIIDYAGNEIYAENDLTDFWDYPCLSSTPIEGVVNVHPNDYEFDFHYIDIGLRSEAVQEFDDNGLLTVKSSMTDDYFTVQFTLDGDGYSLDIDNFYECPSYDASLWSYYQKSNHDGYIYVGTADESQYGFIDEDGNILAMYKGCSDFGICGYALATTNGKTYDLIDSDFNVVSENIFTSTDCCCDKNSNLFSVKAEDGSWMYYWIE